jgi:hypothetical protein
MFGNTILAQHLGFVCRALIPQHRIPDSSEQARECWRGCLAERWEQKFSGY